MKLRYVHVLMGVFVFCPDAHADAAGHHAARALERSGMAMAHGRDGRTEQLLERAEEGLTHARAAEKAHSEAHAHMTEAVQYLKKAIHHAKKDHADLAAQHSEEAMRHMRESIGN